MPPSYYCCIPPRLSATCPPNSCLIWLCPKVCNLKLFPEQVSNVRIKLRQVVKKLNCRNCNTNVEEEMGNYLTPEGLLSQGYPSPRTNKFFTYLHIRLSYGNQLIQSPHTPTASFIKLSIPESEFPCPNHPKARSQTTAPKPQSLIKLCTPTNPKPVSPASLPAPPFL